MKKSIAEIKLSKKAAKKPTKKEVVYDQPFDVQGARCNDLHYDNVQNDDASYTALSKNRKDGDDHDYTHLKKAVRKKETGF